MGQSLVPLGLTNVVAVGAGAWHSLALKVNGQVVCWGDNSFGQCDVPPSLTAVAINAGAAHSLVLTSNGTVVAWGNNYYGQGNASLSLSNALAVVGGTEHTMVLLEDDLPSPQLFHPMLRPNLFSVLVPTFNRKNYLLESKGSLAVSHWTSLSTNTGNGALRVFVDPAANASQKFYRLRRW